MHPAALVFRAWKRLVQRGPEPHGSITNRDLGGDRQATRLDVSQQLVPALRAFPKAGLKADQFLLALPVSRR